MRRNIFFSRQRAAFVRRCQENQPTRCHCCRLGASCSAVSDYAFLDIDAGAIRLCHKGTRCTLSAHRASQALLYSVSGGHPQAAPNPSTEVGRSSGLPNYPSSRSTKPKRRTCGPGAPTTPTRSPNGQRTRSSRASISISATAPSMIRNGSRSTHFSGRRTQSAAVALCDH